MRRLLPGRRLNARKQSSEDLRFKREASPQHWTRCAVTWIAGRSILTYHFSAGDKSYRIEHVERQKKPTAGHHARRQTQPRYSSLATISPTCRAAPATRSTRDTDSAYTPALPRHKEHANSASAHRIMAALERRELLAAATPPSSERRRSASCWGKVRCAGSATRDSALRACSPCRRRRRRRSQSDVPPYS